LILSGAPGTSKTWYADLLARKLTDQEAARVLFVQFHPSYQYEDFVEGYVPDEDTGTFVRKDKHLLLASSRASKSGTWHVVVIDELSRADPARVFGEALTYIEMSKRGKRFTLASGEETELAPKLFVIATMNEFDRGVDDVDAAFDRRMARVEMAPNPELVSEFLVKSGMQAGLATRVRAFFDALQKNSEPAARIGHAYFQGLKTEEDLRRRWDVQLRYVLRKAVGLEKTRYDAIEREWNKVFDRGGPLPAADAEGSAETSPSDFVNADVEEAEIAPDEGV
jgi:5-methylcytosine-specific restriction protein B